MKLPTSHRVPGWSRAALRRRRQRSPGHLRKESHLAFPKASAGAGPSRSGAQQEVSKLIAKGAFILDVRTVMEARKGIAASAKNIPLLRLKRHLDELPRDRTIVTYCGTGERAGKARDMLATAGFQAVNGGSYARIVASLRKQ